MSKTASQISQHRMRSDESIDELAGEALLKDVPQYITKADSLHTKLTANASHQPTSHYLTRSTSGELDKPLPPVPSSTRTADRHDRNRAALAPKTTNLKVRRAKNSQITKHEISPPVLQSTTSTAVKLDSRPPTGYSVTTLPKLQLTANDPMDLNQKINHLMQQAAAQEAESERKEALLAMELAKPSPRQRAKKVFVKASQALRDRLSTGNSAIRSRSDRLPSASPARSAHFSNQTRESPGKVRNRSLSRRMAEGLNLSNPKIQSFMGESSVPRKPLPVYESMRSRSQRQDSSENPFFDNKHISVSRSAQELSSLVVDLDLRKNTSKGNRANDQTDIDTGLPKTSPPAQEGKSNFSQFVSGLGQHSDTMVFSSSPQATSTPRNRLDTHFAMAHKKHRNMSVKSPSILEVSFERSSDDDRSVAPSIVSKTVTDGSQSVKRKSAQDNLRSPLEREAKKAKKSRKLPSDEEVSLAINLNNLNTEDERTPLSPEKQPKERGLLRQPNRKKGLGIFDLSKGKGKEPESRREEHPTRKQRPSVPMMKRSSFSRPSSMLFGRESRAGGKKFAKLDDDEMEADELGSDDPKYLITKGRK